MVDTAVSELARGLLYAALPAPQTIASFTRNFPPELDIE